MQLLSFLPSCLFYLLLFLSPWGRSSPAPGVSGSRFQKPPSPVWPTPHTFRCLKRGLVLQVQRGGLTAPGLGPHPWQGWGAGRGLGVGGDKWDSRPSCVSLRRAGGSDGHVCAWVLGGRDSGAGGTPFEPGTALAPLPGPDRSASSPVGSGVEPRPRCPGAAAHQLTLSSNQLLNCPVDDQRREAKGMCRALGFCLEGGFR